MLSPELWVLIGLHLRPRHAIKLIKTCKEIRKQVDNETYWTRVYTHLVWKDCDALEINPGSYDIAFPRIEENLYYMLGLDQGYYWGMQRFFQRMEEAIVYYSENHSEYTSEEDMEWWATLRHMSMVERSKAWIKKETNIEIALETTTMKDLAKVEVIKSMVHKTVDTKQTEAEQRNFNRFVCEIEDDPMPIKYKRMMMRKIGDLFWHRCETEGFMSPLRATEAAVMMCHF